MALHSLGPFLHCSRETVAPRVRPSVIRSFTLQTVLGPRTGQTQSQLLRAPSPAHCGGQEGSGPSSRRFCTYWGEQHAGPVLLSVVTRGQPHFQRA